MPSLAKHPTAFRFAFLAFRELLFHLHSFFSPKRLSERTFCAWHMQPADTRTSERRTVLLSSRRNIVLKICLANLCCLCGAQQKNYLTSISPSRCISGLSSLIKRLDALDYTSIFYMFNGNNVSEFSNCDLSQQLSIAYRKNILFWPCPQMKVRAILSSRFSFLLFTFAPIPLHLFQFRPCRFIFRARLRRHIAHSPAENYARRFGRPTVPERERRKC